MSNTRDQWKSKIGFILAAAGSAIGLGAVWKLPYVAGTSGGGAFFIIFLAFTLILGTSLLLAEFVIGRKTQKSPIQAYKELAPGTPWYWVGILGIISSCLILSFYAVVGGWILTYFVRSLTGGMTNPPTGDYGMLFGSIISNHWEVGIAHLAFIIITILVVQGGIQKGIERASSIMMPALFVIFIILVIRSLTLDGAMQGVRFFLQPDFSKVGGDTILFALGQAFFSLSLGVSIMVTYSSYLDKKESLVRSASSIVGLSILIAFLSGLAIFPGVFAFGLEPNEGPSLIFTVLPAVFSEMAFGGVFLSLFLLLLLFATLTSAFSLLEIVVSSAARNQPERRKAAAWIGGLGIFVLGIPSNLSYGVLSEWFVFGNTFFDNIDFLVSNILLPLGALLISFFVPLKMKHQDLKEELLRGSGLGEGFFRSWMIMIRYITPIAILFAFLDVLGVW
ncbi:sodium-dependent transporter [Alteribacillus bidgolensis]|uniref:Neurotransmitter:Na+ symporter, NSS family n=1 Tax=Alteribacillus bidgolensis TaxID=930129 RepID=A0A1G8EL82_9BACI|nr:sodium-dependent transporter [Alteribacillus bidgolensis]SDH70627.1 neurotransmitter:Na+ symporter, NSS family [Alteribacillus bidgolensis]